MRKLTALLAVGLICMMSSGAFAVEAEMEISDYPNFIDGTGHVIPESGMLLHFTVRPTAAHWPSCATPVHGSTKMCSCCQPSISM